jgi:hypothetical protein
MGAAEATGLNRPRSTRGSTRSAEPLQRTAPAAYDAQMPWCTSPSPSVIHTCASTRRTPSTKTSPRTGAVPGGGRRGAQRSTGTSTEASTSAVPSARASSSMGEPYSGDQDSTAKRMPAPAPAPCRSAPLTGRPS